MHVPEVHVPPSEQTRRQWPLMHVLPAKHCVALEQEPPVLTVPVSGMQSVTSLPNDVLKSRHTWSLLHPPKLLVVTGSHVTLQSRYVEVPLSVMTHWPSLQSDVLEQYWRQTSSPVEHAYCAAHSVARKQLSSACPVPDATHVVDEPVHTQCCPLVHTVFVTGLQGMSVHALPEALHM